jgi:hypothetical protein
MFHLARLNANQRELDWHILSAIYVVADLRGLAEPLVSYRRPHVPIR